jgi:GNAT superfamily N-acetyltransferase
MTSSLWTRGRAVGCVAVDPSGSIPLVVVAPAHQRRGIGTDLDTLDLVADLRDYCPPAAASERARRADVTIAPTVATDLAAVLAFETATFPSWTRWFQASNRDILIARDRAGTIVATLLFDGPARTPSSCRCSGRRPR